MRSFLFICIFFLTSFQIGLAQETPVPCGSDQVMEREISENEIFRRKLFNLESRLITHRNEGMSLRDGEILVIPTVVHIIHEGEDIGTSSNISNEQVYSAIEALNEDFRKIAGSNGDGNGADVGIEFCLAMRDPNGNSTNGINRVDGSSIPNYAEEGISIGQNYGANELTIKQLSMWPKSDYLNIWIVNEIENNDADSGIQGFAYFPTSSNVDGVTILFNSFGTVGNLKSYTNLNRTTTHEVGHFLGLYHTFHSSSDCNETNCESQGDRVCDTPVTMLNSSCNNPSCGGTQQVENYMDYTGQSCKDMFTEGQKVRMRFTLLEQRSSLLESLGCIPSSNLDLGVSTISSPYGSLCSGTLFPRITLTNYGSSSVSSATISYQIDNGSESEFNWTGNLSSGESTDVTLPTINSGNGNHTFYASVSSPNGNTDEYALNNEAQSSFVVSNGATATINLVLDYMGSDNTWEITQNGNVMASGGPYSDQTPGLVSEEICLSAGCYDFTILDSYGDGMGFLTGSYEVLDGEGEQVVFGQNNWGSEATHSFCMEAVQGNPPEASFSSSESVICAGESVIFNDSSSGNPLGWTWSFEGGNISSSSYQNPGAVAFNSPGTYNISLTVSNGFGSDTETMTIDVQASPDIMVNSQNVSCHGLNDGGATLIISGNPSITWSTGSSGNSLSNLAPGSYNVQVASSGGCTSSLDFTISEPLELDLTLFKSDVSCYEAEDGSITSSVSGGTLPYQFSWTGGESSSSLSGLDEGNYTLTILDSEGCSVSQSTTIIEPSEIVVHISDVTEETCEGSDGSAIANGLGGTGSLSYFWSTGNSGQMLQDVPFGYYTVTVTDALGCSADHSADIPYDCTAVLPTTQLISSQCNITELSLNETLICNAISGIEMYMWQFSDEAGGIIEEAYTMGNNNTFSVSEIDNLSYGDRFHVRIRVQKENSWGEWGNSCSATLLTSPPAIHILEEDCNREYLSLGTTIQAESNSGADEFEWMVSYDGNQETFYTYLNELTISEEMMLPLNEPFEISLRARYDETWSDFSNSCNYSFEIIDYVEGFEFSDANMTIYPNPSSGRDFSLTIDNLPQGINVIDIETFDSNGKLIKAWQKELNGITHISETYSFNSKLSTGIYLVMIGFEGQQRQQKLIVR